MPFDEFSDHGGDGNMTPHFRGTDFGLAMSVDLKRMCAVLASVMWDDDTDVCLDCLRRAIAFSFLEETMIECAGVTDLDSLDEQLEHMKQVTRLAVMQKKGWS